MSEQKDNMRVVSDHRRQWGEMRYVYPVVSRRSKGLSVGVNLNIDKRCNFGCLYCQINRRLHREGLAVDVVVLQDELKTVLRDVASGAIWEHERFAETPAELRRFNDIAFSGDGEPTCLPNFDAAVQAAVDALAATGLSEQCKIVVITNGTQLLAEQAVRALPILDANRGELWVKLDAGTETFFRMMNRPSPKITLEGILAALLATAKVRPVVIQTLFSIFEGNPPEQEEIDAYIGRLRWLIEQGGQIKLIQLHTIARPPSDARVAMLPEPQLRAMGEMIHAALPGIPLEVYPGRDVPPQA